MDKKIREYGALIKDYAEKNYKKCLREAGGELHEYYDPESGEGITNKGFQNWNLLSLNMYEWLEEN